MNKKRAVSICFTLNKELVVINNYIRALVTDCERGVITYRNCKIGVSNHIKRYGIVSRRAKDIIEKYCLLPERNIYNSNVHNIESIIEYYNN